MMIFALLAIPLAILLGLLQALLIVWMWATFVVPTFGLAPLTIPLAWGIALLIAVVRMRTMSDMEVEFTLNNDPSTEDKVKRLGFRMMHHVFTLAFAWLVAWILTFFL